MSCPVFFGGSRSLPVGASLEIERIVSQVVRLGASVVVGCASGADHAVLVAMSRACSRKCAVYCAFGPGGAGAAGSLSSVQGVALASSAGASVHYWAGGGASVPVRARLVRRSQVAAATIAAAGGVCCLFLSSVDSRGSLAAGAVAAAAGSPVFAVPFYAGDSAPAPLPGCAGSWVRGKFAGALCWRWASSAPVLF